MLTARPALPGRACRGDAAARPGASGLAVRAVGEGADPRGGMARAGRPSAPPRRRPCGLRAPSPVTSALPAGVVAGALTAGAAVLYLLPCDRRSYAPPVGHQNCGCAQVIEH
jgi:hypothetical protein